MKNSMIVKVLNGMAYGLFSSLLIGLIIKQVATLIGWDQLVLLGDIAQRLMGPAIGAGVAYSLGAPALGIFACVVAGALGAGTVQFTNGLYTVQIGEPVGALVASWAGALCASLVYKKTKMDIIVVPITVILVGGLVGKSISQPIVFVLSMIGNLINTATQLQPIPMGIILSVVMGMVLTLPLSSAALAISLGLSGLAAGASTVGCACNMIGFAVASFEDNGVEGLISQGIGTSMLQISNIFRKPVIWLPVILTSAILGPISTTVFQLQNNSIGAGMGTSGFVGQFATFDTMGYSKEVLVSVVCMHYIFPAILSWGFVKIFRKAQWIRSGDMKLEEAKS